MHRALRTSHSGSARPRNERKASRRGISYGARGSRPPQFFSSRGRGKRSLAAHSRPRRLASDEQGCTARAMLHQRIRRAAGHFTDAAGRRPLLVSQKQFGAGSRRSTQRDNFGGFHHGRSVHSHSGVESVGILFGTVGTRTR